MTEATKGLDFVATRNLIAALCACDRYQASPGLSLAAEILASHVAGLGFEARTDRRRVDGVRRWWSFESPQPWAPERARLTCPGVVALDETRPCLVAVHSAATAPREDRVVVTRFGEESEISARDALALVPGARFREADLVAAGVRRFATDVAARVASDGTPLRGRIELSKHSALTGFSLTKDELDRLWSASGRTAEAALTLSDSAEMSMVSWAIRGELPGEMLLMAHLCHQQPGANDNVSGVAGLVYASCMLRAMLATIPPAKRRTIRFLAAPEFTGPAADLHGEGEAGRDPPHSVVNLDMIANGAASGGRFCLEMAPSAEGFALEAIVAAALDAVPELAGWRLLPFHGYSDNAIFAAGPFAAPTVQLCHDFDRHNHTDGDTPAQLDLATLRSVSTAASLAAAWHAAPESWGADFALRAERLHRRRLSLRIEAVARRAAGSGEADWALGYREAMHARMTGRRPRRSIDGGFRLDGPLDLRGLLRALPTAEAAEVEAARWRDKATLARLANGIVALAEGAGPKEATRRASYALEEPFQPSTEALVEHTLATIEVSCRRRLRG